MIRQNNFDFLRLVFAALVIISHAYPLTGLSDCDLLCQVTDGQLNFSFIGLKGFFVISGYLVMASALRSQNVVDYIWKRCLRLFPALFVCLLITLPIVSLFHESTSESPGFWHQWSTYSYIPRNVSLYLLQYDIQGVFVSNPYPIVINGSLWTIAYEFHLYLILVPLFLFRKFSKATSMIVYLFFSILVVSHLSTVTEPQTHHSGLVDVILWDLGTYFMGGALLQISGFNLHDRRYIYISACLLGIVTSIVIGKFHLVKYILFAPLVVTIGISNTPFISKVHEWIGDISYGVYIYAFPVQQALVSMYRLDHSLLIFATYLIVFPLAYLSWHLIEKKALRWKSWGSSVYDFMASRFNYPGY